MSDLAYFVEVGSGDECWSRKVTSGRGLTAPDTTRYWNMMSKIKKRDIVFTYLTDALTRDKRWKSSIVGCSKTSSEVYEKNGRLHVDLSSHFEFSIPIKFKDFKDIPDKSDTFDKLTRMSMQSYLSRIDTRDVYAVLDLRTGLLESFLKWEANEYGR